MIELAMAVTIAKLASDGVSALDKIFRGYADFVRKKEPAAGNVPPPDFAFVDAPAEGGMIAKSRHTGAIYQKITYEELASKLDEEDRGYIEALTDAMQSYQQQWNGVFKQIPLESGMQKEKLNGQLKALAKEISTCLVKILEFTQDRVGLQLDDHYIVARRIAQDYIR